MSGFDVLFLVEFEIVMVRFWLINYCNYTDGKGFGLK